MATEFKFVVDGIDLSEEQRGAIAQAVAAAGTVALTESIGRKVPYFEVGGVNLRKWELIGKYLLAGDLAEKLGGQVQGLIDGR
ncbi:hypothetical protein SAMN05192558_105244 [Actinokineospora alba]|uniref:Uncharacterized protein n=1 Tax=Actinokineospora alba TaxID=504798 RepID=A0A1H0N894_9PSEU|nr:hypothetical protein [Actinokineospora alba]TDP68615.1 hypothetical protein C8E96_4180 [Actinokineospora alba]SDH82886.1 hypothetical protein SAMN05421871_102294 [Actinokineospora alba]SDO88878.1 hypothetical protein SAMN05192558_105244 [Actinokineospora alba]